MNTRYVVRRASALRPTASHARPLSSISTPAGGRVSPSTRSADVQRQGTRQMATEVAAENIQPEPIVPLPIEQRIIPQYSSKSNAQVRTDWTKEEIADLYNQPLLELTSQANTVHRQFQKHGAVQLCTLMNIKVGGCTEDCSYCAQSTRYQKGTGLAAKKVETVESVLAAARKAKENGSTRFCMGAAWRDMRGRKNSLKNIVEMVKGVKAMDMEVCTTLGMIDEAQAKELKEAGLTAYNHNLDTSREFYPSIITTRKYDERLKTLDHVRKAGVKVCSGGILGLGEKSEDRISLLHTMSTLESHPESFPVNALVPIKGTPLGEQAPIEFTEILRTIATARLVMPTTIVRIAAGRKTMSEEKQALCFMAGANAIFTGEKMLTTDCNDWDEDKAMFNRWGLEPMAPNTQPTQ